MMRLAASVTVKVTLLACFLFSGAGAADLTMLSPYSRNFIIDQEVTQRYLAIVQSLATGEELSIRLFGPDVVPPFHQLEPVQAGLFDLVLSPPSYHAGNLPAAMALGGLSGNAAAWRAAGIWQAIDEMYRRRGLKLLALPQMGSRSAQITLREPICFSRWTVRSTECWRAPAIGLKECSTVDRSASSLTRRSGP